MTPESVIHKYYAEQPELENLLLIHSRHVADEALSVANRHPELNLDRDFLYEAAMLHDIGIIRCNAPSIYCNGPEHYICHGIEGGKILRNEGLPRHARVAERHTGTGLTPEAIMKQQLPLPLQDFSPETLEEQVVCYADKFYSKTHLDERKTPERILKSLDWFGEEGVLRFKHWHKMFGV